MSTEGALPNGTNATMNPEEATDDRPGLRDSAQSSFSGHSFPGADEPSPQPKKKKVKMKGVQFQSPSGGGQERQPRLTAISRKYDLDGDGVLDEAEQAMRDRDVANRGQLDNAEVYRIVQDQLQSQTDYRRYRKAACGLFCLVVVLALSNFGTSWATAMLSKDTVAESESGTVQSKKTREVVGLQNVAYLVEFDELTSEEYYERRRLVEEEMLEEPDHENHRHRKLGVACNSSGNGFARHGRGQCTKVAYDHGKIPQSDLEDITRRCDGVNTVNLKRRWRNNAGGYDEDYDTLCEPGSVVVRKGRKKNNRHKTKKRVVDDHVVIRKRGKKGDRIVSFDCDRGQCYTSGETLLQREGHPCNPRYDVDGASECHAGLVCYDPDHYGSGICTKLQKLSRGGMRCDVDLGVDACESGHWCRCDGPYCDDEDAYYNGRHLQGLGEGPEGHDDEAILRGNAKEGRELQWRDGNCPTPYRTWGSYGAGDAVSHRGRVFRCTGGNNGAVGAVGGNAVVISGPSGTIVAGNRAGANACDAAQCWNAELGGCFHNTSRECRENRATARWCEMPGYEPGVDPAWSQAWTDEGTCYDDVRPASGSRNPPRPKNQVLIGQKGPRQGFNLIEEVPPVRVGTCERVPKLARSRAVCDASYGTDACGEGYYCLASNGSELRRGGGLGFCTRLPMEARSGGMCDLSYGGRACGSGYYCHDGLIARSAGRNACGLAQCWNAELGGCFHNTSHECRGNRWNRRDQAYGVNGSGAGVDWFNNGRDQTRACSAAQCWNAELGRCYSNTSRECRGGVSAAGYAYTVVARSTGTGVCMRALGAGARCETDYECGWGRTCVGLGASAGSSGSLQGPSGTVTWGTGGAASGYCG